jgi:hypothetical protein
VVHPPREVLRNSEAEICGSPEGVSGKGQDDHQGAHGDDVREDCEPLAPATGIAPDQQYSGQGVHYAAPGLTATGQRARTDTDSPPQRRHSHGGYRLGFESMSNGSPSSTCVLGDQVRPESRDTRRLIRTRGSVPVPEVARRAVRCESGVPPCVPKAVVLCRFAMCRSFVGRGSGQKGPADYPTWVTSRSVDTLKRCVAFLRSLPPECVQCPNHIAATNCRPVC